MVQRALNLILFFVCMIMGIRAGFHGEYDKASCFLIIAAWADISLRMQKK